MSEVIATEPHANSRDGGRNVVRMKHKGRATLLECFTFQRKEKAKIDRGTLIPSCLSCGNRHALFFFSIGPNQGIAPTPCPEVMSLRQSWLDWVGADGVGRIGDTYTHIEGPSFGEVSEGYLPPSLSLSNSGGRAKCMSPNPIYVIDEVFSGCVAVYKARLIHCDTASVVNLA